MKLSRNKNLIICNLFILFLILIFQISAADITPEIKTDLENFRSQLEIGNFKDLFTKLDKTDPQHLSVIFSGMDNKNLVHVWNNMEVKQSNGNLDIEKTNKYRQMLLDGLKDKKEDINLFISELIKKNSNIIDFEFSGVENSAGVNINGDFIDFKDSNGNIHKLSLKDLTGFKKIYFSDMKEGGNGYAMHYVYSMGRKSGAVLSRGYLKGNEKNGFDILENEGSIIKNVGHISFGDNPQEAIYFRGIPKEVDGEKFSLGDYIFNKPGRDGDINFKDSLGNLESSKRDLLNGQGDRVGFQNEEGLRGVKKIDTNGDNIPDKIIDITHQNGVGVKYGDKVIGANSKNVLEIKDRGEDIEAGFSKNIINAEITNQNGKVFYKDESGNEVNAGKGYSLKIVNGKTNTGVFVDRQDSGAGTEGGRVDGSGETTITHTQELVNQEIQDEKDRLTSENNNQNNQNIDPSALAVHNYLNKYRGKELVWDEKIAEVARKYSVHLSTGVPFNHDQAGGFNSRLSQIGGNGGENIAYFSTSEELNPEEIGRRLSVQWINSRGHRNNILGNWKRTGVGIYSFQRGGMYYHYGTQIFAN
ncbi:MAG: CAP domain-containing protein [Candidatus Pacearchaeota archaeon]|jgi:uncharacterized protein YkwD